MHSLDTTSLWIDSTTLPSFPALHTNLKVDAVVIGGGLTGITTAYLLKRAGLTVALLERAHCARVDTGLTTAHLTAVTDIRLQELMRDFDAPTARAVWDAGGAAMDQVFQLIRAHEIDCEFRWVPGYLHAPLGDRTSADLQELERETAAANELGIPASFMSVGPLGGLPGIQFPHQAIFHPRKYLAALLKLIPGGGSHVFEETAATEITESPVAVKTEQGEIRCDYVVLATHNPLMGHTPLLKAMLFQTKLALYTSYALAAKIPVGVLPEGAFWDTGDPYYYLRVERQGDHDRAVFGGEDHKTGQETDTAAVFRRLEERFLRLVPPARVTHRWSGQVIQSHDGLPYIGETAERQFVATGFGGNGMTFGTLGAMMAVDAVFRRKNPWQELFDVHRRKLLNGAWDYLKENKDYPYYMLRDHLTPAPTDDLGQLERNVGKILNVDGRKVAAYRDAHGKVTLCSPICPHLGCIVGWNGAEQTWDCPCHGSRFQPTGEVIAGPAEKALEKIPHSA